MPVISLSTMAKFMTTKERSRKRTILRQDHKRRQDQMKKREQGNSPYVPHYAKATKAIRECLSDIESRNCIHSRILELVKKRSKATTVRGKQHYTRNIRAIVLFFHYFDPVIYNYAKKPKLKLHFDSLTINTPPDICIEDNKFIYLLKFDFSKVIKPIELIDANCKLIYQAFDFTTECDKPFKSVSIMGKGRHLHTVSSLSMQDINDIEKECSLVLEEWPNIEA